MRIHQTPDYPSLEKLRAHLIPTGEEDRWDQGELPSAVFNLENQTALSHCDVLLRLAVVDRRSFDETKESRAVALREVLLELLPKELDHPYCSVLRVLAGLEPGTAGRRREQRQRIAGAALGSERHPATTRTVRRRVKEHCWPWLLDRLVEREVRERRALEIENEGSPWAAPQSRGAALQDSVLFVRVPRKGIAVPVSRRDLLGALGIGALGGMLLGALDRALGGVTPTHQMLVELEQELDGFRTAARTMTAAPSIDALTVRAAVLDALRRRAANDKLHHDFAVLQSRYAESLSWMHEEAGDLNDAVYWTDRAAHWAQATNWIPMVAYAFVRRSMMAISFADDGLRAVENAQYVLQMPSAPAYIKGLAAKQMAYGYALLACPDDSVRALDMTMRLLEQQPREDEGPVLGQRSVVDDDLFAIFQTTCDIYLGGGESAIRILEPRLAGIAKGSRRTYTISRAKLACAYANVGQPDKACSLILETLDATDAIGSLSAGNELRRALPELANWSDRSDVQEVRHRLAAS